MRKSRLVLMIAMLASLWLTIGAVALADEGTVDTTTDPYNWTAADLKPMGGSITVKGVYYFRMRDEIRALFTENTESEIIIPDTIDGVPVVSVDFHTKLNNNPQTLECTNLTVGANVETLRLRATLPSGADTEKSRITNLQVLMFRDVSKLTTWSICIAENGRIYLETEEQLTGFLKEHKANLPGIWQGFWKGDEQIQYSDRAEWMPYFCVGEPGNIQIECVPHKEFLYEVDSDSASVAIRLDRDMNKSSLEIPDTVSGKPVTEIMPYAFGGLEYDISRTVTSCSIPSSIVSIGENAFIEHFALNTLVIRGTPQLETIGESAFWGSPFAGYFGPEEKQAQAQPGSVIIPDSVKTICSGAFGNHIGRKEDGNLYYRSVYIPKGVETIGEEAFGVGFQLETVEIEAGSNAVIEPYAFGNRDDMSWIYPDRTTSLKSFIVGGGSTVTIKENAFANATTNLQTIKIPSTSIAETNAFPVPANGEVSSVKTTCTVSFDTKGGDAIGQKEVAFAAKLMTEDLAAPNRSGYTFQGWYTDENYAEAYDMKWLVTEDMTLYAKWEAIADEPINSGDTPNSGGTVPPANPDNKPKQPDSQGSVKTGDNNHVTEWIALVLISGGALAGITVYRRRRKHI